MTHTATMYRKPVYVSALLCVFFLVMGISLSKFQHHRTMLLEQKAGLIDECVVFDELSEVVDLQYEDDYLEEMDLFIQLDWV